MARNIAKAGLQVRAWDRTPDKAAPLAKQGASIVLTSATYLLSAPGQR